MNNIKLLKILILHAPGNVYMKNVKGKYLVCNQNQLNLVGLSNLEEIINKTDYDLYENEIASKVIAVDEEIIKNKVEVTFEEDGVNKEGKPAIYLTKKTPIFNEKGKVIALSGISIDITKEKQAEKAKSEFISNINHDLRTHISMVVSIASFLQDSSEKYPDIKEYFDLLANSSNQIYQVNEAIINNMYSLNKELQIECFFIEEEINKIHELINPSLFLKQLDFVVNFCEKSKDLKIKTDKSFMSLILRELITNAINFTDKGSITVSIKQIYNNFLISIEDTGIGISSERINDIFEPFTKIKPSNKDAEKFKGFGMGLNNAKKYASLLGGEITVKSNVNKGSIFNLIFPLEYIKNEE